MTREGAASVAAGAVRVPAPMTRRGRSSPDSGRAWQARAVTTTRGRRLEPDARREQLLQCAITVFGEKPYAEVSTTEIAAAAGIARGLLNHYFGTKRDLYLEVVRRLVAVPEVDGLMLRGSTRSRIDTGVGWFLDAVAPHGRTFLAVTGAGGIGDDPEIEAIIAEPVDLPARRVLEVVGLDGDDEAS